MRPSLWVMNSPWAALSYTFNWLPRIACAVFRPDTSKAGRRLLDVASLQLTASLPGQPCEPERVDRLLFEIEALTGCPGHQR